MAQIQVTARQLRTQAENLQQLNESFRSQIQVLESTEASLAGMWDGESKDAFHSAFLRDKGQMEAFKAAIDQYVTALQNIAQKYEQAENTNRETAINRTY